MNHLNFAGNGWKFFKLLVIDIPVAILSLTLLIPWAAVREYRYLASVTTLGGIPFRYEGRVLPYFKQYLKTFLVTLIGLGLLLTLAILATKQIEPRSYWATLAAQLVYIVYILLITPFVVHGSLSFHSRLIQWGTTAFAWKGKISALFPLLFQGYLICFLTLGLYTPWLEVRLNQYFLRNMHLGGLRFDFDGDPKELFKIYLKGFFLGILTLGIYQIWNYKSWYQYTINHLVVRKGEHSFNLHAQANTLDVFELLVGNTLLIVFTLGLAFPFAYIRYMRFLINHCIVPETVNLELIEESDGSDGVVEETATHWMDKWNPKLVI